MKVLYITEIYPDPRHGLGVWGGGEKQFYEISRLAANRGHEIAVLTCRFPGQPREEFVEGVRVLRVGLSREPRTGAARREVLPVLSYILRTGARALTLDADLIHCNTYFPVYSGKTAARLRKIPLVTTFHDIYRLTDWISSQGSFLWGLAGHVVTTIAAKLPHDRIIAVSPQCKRKLISIGIHSENITVIPNGVDLSLFDSTDAHKVPYQVLYVGRLVPTKNVDKLIRAFPEILKRVPDATLKIVGHGPESESLKQLVCDLSLQPKVIFAGTTSTYESVARYFKESALFVLPSTVEGESIASKEAMAANLPVVATRIAGSGVLSLVEDGVNGFLVDPGRPSMLAERIVELLQDDRKSRAMGAAGRRFVQEFDWEVIADRTLQLYTEVKR